MLKRIDERYSINDEGDVFSYGYTPVQPRLDGGGLVVNLHGNRKSVSKLLLEIFVGPKPKKKWPVCKDGNVRNVNLKNWKWDWTPSTRKRMEASAMNKERIKQRIERNRLAKIDEARVKAATKREAERQAKELNAKVVKAKKAPLVTENSRLPSFRPCDDCGVKFRSISSMKCPKCRVVKPYISRWD